MLIRPTGGSVDTSTLLHTTGDEAKTGKLTVTDTFSANAANVPVTFAAYPGGAASYAGIWFCAPGAITGSNYSFLAHVAGGVVTDTYLAAVNSVHLQVNSSEALFANASATTVSSPVLIVQNLLQVASLSGPLMASAGNVGVLALGAGLSYSAGTLSATGLVPTAVKTSNYAAAPWDFVPLDCTTAPVIVTLPTAPADGTRIGVKLVAAAAGHSAAVACGAGDTVDTAAGPVSAVLSLTDQAITLQYKASAHIWYATGNDLPLSQTDARYSPLAGSTSLVTVGTITAGTWQGTAIDVAHGGNGLTTATLGDLRYGSGTNTLAALAGNTTAVTKWLGQTGTGTASAAPAWGNPLTVGNPVAGGAASKLLCEDSSQNLAAGPAWDGTTLTVGAATVNGVIQLGSSGTDTFLCAGATDVRVNLNGNRTFTVKNSGVVPTLSTYCSATPAAPAFTIDLNSSTTRRTAGAIDATFPTSTDASRRGRLVGYAADFTGTNREGWRVESDGTQALVGFYGATAVAKAASPGTAGGTDAAVINAVITILRNLGLCS